MTLDRLTPLGTLQLDGRDFCRGCGDNVPHLTSAHLCAYCSNRPPPPVSETPKEYDMTSQPDPRFPDVPPEQVGETVMLPEYCVNVAELLAATENHRDAGVRAIRKIVIQAALALDHAQQAVPPACRKCGCTDTDACFPTCSWVEPDLCSACVTQTSGSDAPGGSAPVAASTSGPETPTHQKRRSSSAVLLMNKHDIQAADVRDWCTTAGIDCPPRGSIPMTAVEAYCQANGLEAA